MKPSTDQMHERSGNKIPWGMVKESDIDLLIYRED